MLNLSSAFEECRAYLEAIADFEIDTPGEVIESEDTITQLSHKVSIKSLLYRTFFSFEQDASNGSLALIDSLDSSKRFWRAQQYEVINQCNEIINRKTGLEREHFEEKKDQLISFFQHTYTLIDLLNARLTSSKLDTHLQFKLESVGLSWIVEGVKPRPKDVDEYSTAFEGSNQIDWDHIEDAEAWGYKIHFDELPTYSERLQYWVELFGSPPSHAEHRKRHTGKQGKELFTFTIQPSNESELRELRRSQLDYNRHTFAEMRYQVKTFAWRPDERDIQEIAFSVKSYASLKSSIDPKPDQEIDIDLEIAYLSKVLMTVTKSIDLAGRTKNGVTPTLSRVTEEVRLALMKFRQIVDPDELELVGIGGTKLNRNEVPYDVASPDEIDFDLKHSPDEKIYYLGLIWDIVHFENYLKIRLSDLKNAIIVNSEEVSGLHLRTSTASFANKRSETIRTGDKDKVGFESYITEVYRDRLMPFLLERYSGSKPQEFGYMLHALHTLDVIPATAMTANQTKLHSALEVTFGTVGTRQVLNKNINVLDRASAEEERIIREHADKISAVLHSPEAN